MKAATTTLIFCVGGLLSLGLVMLYSAGMLQGAPRYLVNQLTWCGLGLVVCCSAMVLDYRHLKKISIILLLVAIVALAAVLVPGIGVRRNGARRWFDLGHCLVQPSEFARLALIIALAHYGERYQRHMTKLSRGVLVPGIVIALVLGLIFVEPDRGSTVLLAAVSATMLLIAGVRWRYFVPPLLAAAAGLVYSLLTDSMRSARIFSWLNLEQSKEGSGYQAYQAMLALGSGGPTGLGLGNGRQKFGFVPEHHTDFIFSIIGEELGLVATLSIVFAFVALVCCGVYIARHARDTFGLLLGAGLTFLIGLQAFINIGVVTSALPNKGMPLPFISYGGSNLLIMLTSVGLLLSIARGAPENPLAAQETLEPARVSA